MYSEGQNLLLDLVKDAWMLTAALLYASILCWPHTRRPIYQYIHYFDLY